MDEELPINSLRITRPAHLQSLHKRPPSRLGDPHPRDLDRFPAGGLRSCESEAHQHGLPTSFIK